MLDKAHLKLVTIIASYELQERFERHLERLGASGYTVCQVGGHGDHGTRKRGLLEIGNVRIESLVTPSVAEAILEQVARDAGTLDVLAFAIDAEAVPASRFA